MDDDAIDDDSANDDARPIGATAKIPARSTVLRGVEREGERRKRRRP